MLLYKNILLLCYFALSHAGEFHLITDTHINNYWMDSSKQNYSLGNVLDICRTYTSEPFLRPGKYGSFGCSSSLELWEESINKLHQENSNPNFIISPGDAYGHLAPPDTENLVLGANKLLADLLHSMGLNR